MSKMYKLPILWSVDCDPHSIIKMVDDERISALIERGKFRCRIGSLLQNRFDIRYVVVSPSEPHGLISDIYKEDDAWYGDLFIPEIGGWDDLVDNMKDPILHPLVNVNSNGEFRIVHFAIMDRTDVDENRTYDGIHCDASEDAAITAPMKLFLIEISDAQNYSLYEHFGISIIVEAKKH